MHCQNLSLPTIPSECRCDNGGTHEANMTLTCSPSPIIRDKTSNKTNVAFVLFDIYNKSITHVNNAIVKDKNFRQL